MPVFRANTRQDRRPKGGGSFRSLLPGGVLVAFEQFFTKNLYITGGINAKASLAAFDFQDRNLDMIADDDGFTNASRQDQHRALLCKYVVVAEKI
jgi:hypothetical protein